MKYDLSTLTSRSKSPVMRSMSPTRLLKSRIWPFIVLSTEAILRANSSSLVPPLPEARVSDQTNSFVFTLQRLP